MTPNLILIGAPGSGKGTQSAKLISRYSYKHISTGDLLRAEIAKCSDLGKRVSAIMAQGNLVDDDTVMELLAVNCDLKKSHYIFDGFPRNAEQAVLLNSFLSESANGQTAIYLKIDTEIVVKRISQRRVCSKCAHVYSLASVPQDGACIKCGEVGAIIQRKDDMPEVVENRMKVFSNAIRPMLEFYEAKKMLKALDAADAEDVVFKKISDLIDNFKVNS
jgi:adenylate kinase